MSGRDLSRQFEERVGYPPNVVFAIRQARLISRGKAYMPTLPTGTVTFLFADIEGSTRLLRQIGGEYADVLTEYRRLLEHAIENAGGRDIGDQGDACFAAFSRATDALTAAISAQRGIGGQSWPGGIELRVRMGLHTGEAQPMEGNYVGMAVHIAARICTAGHGGQILISDSVQALVADHAPTGVAFRDLGKHRLKDLAYPTHLYQVVVEGLPAQFPPPRSLGAVTNNLPVQTTSFIGRKKEIASVKELLSDSPLVTLTGSGGVGKTRLAIQIAADLLDAYRDGVWLVELARLSDPTLVPKEVASSLGVPEHPGHPLLDTLVDAVRSRSLLLILDGCEHLLASCALLCETLLRACPGLRIVATSREPLNIRGEALFRVPSLSVADLTRRPSVEQLLEYESVRLFADRAALGQIGFEITSHNAAAVAQITRRLDGIPLAIELAAARIKSLPITVIAERLDDRLRLLTGGRAGLLRHQTLRAALDWSHDLLSAQERMLFRRLSVFAGSFALDAAEQICAGEGLDDNEILDLLTHLVDKSLVTFAERNGEARYRLLETIGQYGREKLKDAGEANPMERHHRDWYLALAERAEPQLRGSGQAEWLERLESEHDNFRKALQSSASSGDDEATARLTCALWWFWYIRGHHREGRERLETAAGASAARPALRLRALHGIGYFAARRGDTAGARAAYEQALEIAKSLGDSAGIAESLYGLGRAASVQRDYERAGTLFQEARRLAEAAGDRYLLCRLLNSLGIIAAQRRDFPGARGYYGEGLTSASEAGNRWIAGYLTANLGVLAFHEGAYQTALSNHREALAIHHELKDRWGTISSLEDLGLVAAALGRTERAARLLAAAEAQAELLGLRLPIDPLNACVGDYIRRVRDGLGEELAAARFGEGRALTLDAAVSLALSD